MKKILIIEDDQIVANVYRNKFSLEGFDVDIANDGVSGLESIRSFRPDAVVLDLMLPRMTGVDLMKQVRTDQAFAKLPIIVFSNTYLTNMVQEAWKAGATKCLSKANCTPKQLLEVVRGTLSIAGDPAHKNGKSKAAPDPEPPSGDAAAAAGQNDRDVAFQAELRADFTRGLPATLTAVRGNLQSVIKATDQATRLRLIEEMYKRIHGVTSNAGITGMLELAQMADALEALLKELHQKPKNLNTSTLRTVASAVDLLGTLANRTGGGPSHAAQPQILVVDDEAISRRAVTYALERAKLKPTALETPQAAYDLLIEKPFDLIFLDVDMPGMNGFELCAKLRTLAAHKTTPVVFVTSLNDLESRANSTMSGGNDFIGKPFLFLELTVKALGYLLRPRPVAAA